MNDATLKLMVGAALIMLLVFQAGSAVAGLVSAAAGGIAAVVVAAVTLFCAYRASAGDGNWAWLLVPAVLFTLLPLGISAWGLYSADTSLFGWLVSLTPLLVGFLLPVLLLWLVYSELGKRSVGR